MPNNIKCLICNGQLLTIASCQARTGLFCNCARCGRYEVADGLFHDTNETFVIDEKLKSSMYYFLTQIKKELKKESQVVRFEFENNDVNEISDNSSLAFISQKGLMNIFPVDLDDQISMILVNFLNLCSHPGESIFKGSSFYYQHHLFFLNTGEEGEKMKECEWWIDTLIELGYVQKKTPDILLTLEGWKRANSYVKENSTSKTVFVAMHFHKELESARQEILQAINSAGFLPVIIDMKEHNNQIVPEILYEIRNSRFVVADFTNQRGGVYYEAGYAEGLNIPVIALCRDDDFPNVHFDLRQKNAIIWSKEREIYDKLRKRILATTK